MIVYPLDGSGKAATNKIVKEPIKLRKALNRATTVEAGTFYLLGLFLEDKTGKTYTYGKDYYAAMPCEAAKAYFQTDNLVSHILVITNPEIPDDILVTYQTPGGMFNVVTTAFVDAYYASGLADHPMGYRSALLEVSSYPQNFWDNSAFIGDISKNIGFEHIVTAYQRIAEILSTGDPHATNLALMFMRLTMNTHLQDKDPHKQYLLRNNFQAIGAVLPPVNLAPAKGSVNVKPTDALVGGAYKAMYGLQQIGALFQISTNADFTTGIVQEKLVSGNTNRCDLLPSLVPGLKYYWRVRYLCEELDQSPWSTPTDFIINAGQPGTMKTVALSGAGTYNIPADVGGFVLSGRGARGYVAVTPAIPPHAEVWNEGAVIVNPLIGTPTLQCSIGTGNAFAAGALLTTVGGKIKGNEFGLDFEMKNGERVRVKFEILISIPNGSWVNGSYQYDQNGTWLLKVAKIKSITRSNGDILQDVGNSTMLDTGSVVWRNTPMMTDPGSAGTLPVERKFFGQAATVKVGAYSQTYPGSEGDADPPTFDASLHTAQVGRVLNYVVPTGAVLNLLMVTTN